MVKEQLKSSLNYQKNYKHVIIRDIPYNKEEDNDLSRINRIICYPNIKFDPMKIIKKQILGLQPFCIHFVSQINQCIMSIYDDRGCDIVFYDKNKYIEFFPLLKEFFLDCDLELMEKRLKESQIK